MVGVTLKIELSKDLKLSDIPETLKTDLIDKLTIPNPKWLENARMGRWNRNVPKLLRFFHRYKDTLWIPQGIPPAVNHLVPAITRFHTDEDR